VEVAFRGLKAQARKTVQAISTGLRDLATLILRIAKILSKRLKLGASNRFVTDEGKAFVSYARVPEKKEQLLVQTPKCKLSPTKPVG